MSSDPSDHLAIGLEAKYSCLVCHKRKVKCDRGRPCSNCTRNNVECEYRAPPAPRRRKKRGIDPALAEKLRRYEEQLRRSGVELDEDGEIIDDDITNASDQDDREGERNIRARPSKSRTGSRTQTPLKAEEGTLIVDAGKSRYLESGLWVTLSDQLPNQRPLLQDQPENATEDDSSQSASNSKPLSILLGKQRGTDKDPIEAFPRPDHVWILWREFLRNVDPIVKMIHAPTIEKMMQLSCQNVHSLPRNKLTLLFSIFLCAVASMTDEDVRSKLGQSKSSLYRKYACSTEKCFVRSGLLRTTDINILIAFMLYLVSLKWKVNLMLDRAAHRI
jgi:Fungal Zn(2)-Cys(6) binuclear cluster domain